MNAGGQDTGALLNSWNKSSVVWVCREGRGKFEPQKCSEVIHMLMGTRTFLVGPQSTVTCWNQELDSCGKGPTPETCFFLQPTLPAPAVEEQGPLIFNCREVQNKSAICPTHAGLCLNPGDCPGVAGAAWVQTFPRKARLWQLLAECQSAEDIC